MQHPQIKIGNMPRGQRVAAISPAPPAPPDFQAQLDALSATVADLQAQINALKSAPTNIVLSYDDSKDVANWTYNGDAPPQWEISYSQDNGASWPTVSSLDGGNGSCAPDVEPSLMRLRALNAGGSAISDYSNSVNVG